jgi:dihydroorotate dehydrogenase (fumarate)
MMDLTTSYLGIRLKNPIVASSSPMWESVSNIRTLKDSGVSAVVLPSFFEEQLQMEGQYLDQTSLEAQRVSERP